jgi:signal peptidase I
MNNMEPGTIAARFPVWLRIAVIGRNPKRTLLRAGVLAVVCYIFFKFFVFKVIVLPVQIDGNSMFPTYRDHTRNYVNKLAYVHVEPQRGDIVGIRMSGEHMMLLKRIVGMPGETISFDQGHLFVNGVAIPEPYLPHPLPAPSLDPVKLGPTQYYVIGDNRIISDRGWIERARIVGKIVL